jgi:NAD(P)-dependent dehydrogenase (short-subunit alcohol dehydrogenase family)
MKSGGHIVNVSSEAVEMSFPGLALYQASKAGLERLSRSLYQELEPRGIRVTVLRAGKMFDPDPGGDLDAPVPQGGARGMPAKVDLAGLDISNVDNVAGTICRMIDMPDDLCAELVVLHGRRRQSGEAAGQSDFK